MTHPDPRRSGEATPRPGEAGSSAEQPDPAVANPETAYGGADAVEKTSYVVGRGTAPSGRADGQPNAHPPAGAGPNYLAWGIGAVAALIGVFYLLSLLA